MQIDCNCQSNRALAIWLMHNGLIQFPRCDHVCGGSKASLISTCAPVHVQPGDVLESCILLLCVVIELFTGSQTSQKEAHASIIMITHAPPSGRTTKHKSRNNQRISLKLSPVQA